MPIKKYMKKNSIVEIIPSKSSLDETDKPDSSFHVTNLDIFVLIYSVVIHIVDVAFDINLAYAYFKDDKYIYFAWTVSFMLVPTMIITFISLRMYKIDNDYHSESRKAVQKWFLRIIILFLQLASTLRYCESLNWALRSRRAEKQGDKKKQEEYYRKMLNEDSNVALLRVFECYLESAPQQILQITILLVEYSYGSTFHVLQQCLSIGSSFFAMAWCMASYQRAIRFDQDNKNNISWTGTIVQFLWHLNVTISRILSISVMGSICPIYTSIAVGAHWVAMSIWLSIIDNTGFCSKSRILESSFSAMVGLIYIFNFISLRDGPTKFYYLAYYPICFIENVVAVTIWGVLQHKILSRDWYYYPLVIIPVISFLLGMIFLIIYYQYLHPNKSGTSVSVQTDSNGIKKDIFKCNGNRRRSKGEEEDIINEANQECLLDENVQVGS